MSIESRAVNRVVLDRAQDRAVAHLDHDGQAKRWMPTAHEKDASPRRRTEVPVETAGTAPPTRKHLSRQIMARRRASRRLTARSGSTPARRLARVRLLTPGPG